jgi:hypothetical protein
MKFTLLSNQATKFLTFLVISFFSLTGFSQQVEKDKIYFISAEQTKGTFQFEVTAEEFCSVNLTAELMEKIEKNRHSSNYIYLPLNENCRIKIFPASMIPELRKKPIESCSVVKFERIEK